MTAALDTNAYTDFMKGVPARVRVVQSAARVYSTSLHTSRTSCWFNQAAGRYPAVREHLATANWMQQAMPSDDPIDFFITWTVYGTHLQGDERGWRRRRKGEQLPQPRLARWRRERLKHGVLQLSPDQRAIVALQCRRHCDHRRWKLWEVNARSNHVHVLVTAPGYSGDTVRDQLKANCTAGLRKHWTVFCDRPVWTVGGDWECINSGDDLDVVCLYVREAQDRMSRN